MPKSTPEILRWFHQQPYPKASKNGFFYRVACGMPREAAIVPKPRDNDSDYAYWSQAPFPKISRGSFLANIAKGMTREGAIMTHIQRMEVWMVK